MKHFWPIIVAFLVVLFGSVYIAKAAGCTPFLVASGGTGDCTFTSGNLIYGNGTAALSTVSTSTPTITAPLQYSGTLGSFVGGANGAFSIIQSGIGTNGYLSSTDWNLFNNKISSSSLSVTTSGTSGAATYTPSTGIFNIPQYQAGGNYITALIGDVSASGPGSVAATLATVNSSVGTFTNTTLTVNGKGLITAASSGFAYPFINSATSSILTFSGGLVSVGSTTINGNATTTGTFFATVASSTNLYGAGLFGCNSASNALTWNAGTFGCNTISSGGTSFGKTWEINAFNALAPTTTIGINVNASSTIGAGTNTAGLTIAGGATTTGTSFLSGNVGIGMQPSALLALNVTGKASFTGAVQIANGAAATPSLLFQGDTTSGLFLPSGNNAVGVTAAGAEVARFDNSTGSIRLGVGTTTPGTLLSIGNTNGINFSTATSTFNSTGGISISAGCYAILGNCLTAGSIGGGFTQAVNWATTAVLAGTPTYSNGTAGVGGTLTEIGTGALSVDSNSPAVGDRVLVKNQASALQNGIYSVTATGSGIASYILTRATDYNSPTEITPGINTYVLSGTANSDTTWAVSFTPPLVIGTNSLTYAESSAGGTVTSVAASVPAFLSISGSPITSSGTLAITYSGTALPIANGGTNSTATPGLNSLLYFNGSGMIATSSQPLYVGSLFATSTTLASYFAGSLGIGSTTPLATFSVGSGTASSSILVAEYAYGKTGNNATSTTATLSPRTANTIYWGLGNAGTTLTLCNFQPGDTLKVIVSNPNATAGTLTWAVCAGSQLYWTGGTIPTQTTTASKRDVWSFIATDNVGSTSPATIDILGAQTANF